MTAGAVDRIPPQNLEAEMALLGSILVDREMMATVAEVIEPADFYAAMHETIYTALLALYERGEPLDKITLSEELKRRGHLEKVGGLAYLTSLMDTVPTAASAEYYANIVREKSSLRGLIHAGTQITRIGYEGEDDVEGAIDASEQIVYEVGRRQQHGKFTPVSQMLKPVFDNLDRLFSQRGDRTGITSGFRDLDEHTAGFQPGNLIILAARPGMGKTSMMLTMAGEAARIDRKPIAVFSLEMTNEELVQRLLASAARLDSQKLKRGNIHDSEWTVLSEAMSQLSSLPIYLDDSGAITVTEIRSRCRRLKASSNGLGLILIDYLQLVRPGQLSKGATRNEEISEICRMLKQTAKDLEVPIIAAAQLNRAVEARQDKRPMLSDLRDCLAGDALIANADTGERIAVKEIIDKGLRFNVWAVDEHLELVRRPITDAWTVGEQRVYRVTMGSGRTIRCTAGHRFRTVSGWKELRELGRASYIAVPRRYGETNLGHTFTPGSALLLGWLLGDGHLGGSAALTVATREEAQLAASLAAHEFGLVPTIKPERPGIEAQRVIMTTGRACGAGKNPLTSWLRSLGVWHLTGAEKHVPTEVFKQPSYIVAQFLRGLFHADGSFTRSKSATRCTVRLSTISERMAREVQHLLLRLGINATVKVDRRNIGGYRTQSTAIWTVSVMQRPAVAEFMDQVGFLGKKHDAAFARLVREKCNDAGQVDRIPLEVNQWIRDLKEMLSVSHAELGWREQGKAMSRGTCAMLAEKFESADLETLAYSDVLWDRIVSVDAEDMEPVYDITVGDLHNFCVDDIITHNSGAIEQEADIVAFLYRDDYYNKETADPGVTELILAKHRNGRTGTLKLLFQPEYTRFVAYADSARYAAP